VPPQPLVSNKFNTEANKSINEIKDYYHAQEQQSEVK